MNRIKELRLIKGLKQSEVASDLNVAQNTLSTWEIGRYEPDNETLKQLSDYFGVTVDYLLGRPDTPIPYSPCCKDAIYMKRLIELRQKRGLTQREVAQFLGVDRTTYVKYERGDSEPNFDTILRLADFFETTTDYILGKTDTPIPYSGHESDKTPIFKEGGTVDENPQIETMTVQQVYEEMRALGIKTTPSKIRAALDQGKYPFGISIKMKTQECEIYRTLFDEWVEERISKTRTDRAG